ncbi:Tripartite motif-containing protein 29 [Rhynchospora pubera]|uniref:Tripartite motif-containing protein 29 n=1 Tax=Rhynchospora pubera TaxID=906938 RepID=A0AAV8BT82_9POAL|nr:Tripartite motif-containing protein 29 [Rhynchospora pubera]
METESLHPQPSISDEESDDGSDSFSFDTRQLIGAEAENMETLPEVEGLCISGEARLGHTIQVVGFGTNGTVRCDFAWLRFYDDGSRCYIAGEEKAEHLVTADDVDSYLAVDVIPIGREEQMGDLVRIFANGHRKITCGNQMQDAVEQSFFNGHESFDVYLVEHDNSSKRVQLKLMKDRFIIKNRKFYTVVEQKFMPDMTITIPTESTTGFEIHCSGKIQSLLLEADTSTLRDLIVLIMRSFLLRATHTPKENKRTNRCCLF